MSAKYFLELRFWYFWITLLSGSQYACTAFSQDTIRYYQEGKLVEEIYRGEKDLAPKSALLPRLGFGLQMLSPSSYPNRVFSSRFWAVGGQYRRLLSQKKNISIGIGVEFVWNNLRWQTDNFLTKNQDSIRFVDNSFEQVRKNKLSIFGVSVPIIFYKTFEKNWRVGIGGYTDFRLQSFSRVAYRNGSEQIDTKNFSDFHLSPFRAGVLIEAKYKFLRFFGKYDINPLFNTQKALPANLWTFGIGF